MKKIIIIVAIILGILAIGLGVYFAWKNSRVILNPPTVSQPVGLTVGSTTGAVGATRGTGGTGQMPVLKLKILSDQPIFDYWAYTSSSGQTETFYLNQNGQILKIKGEGEKEESVISSEPIENLQAIKASPDGKQILIKSGSFISPNLTIFNVETEIQQPLPSGVTAAAWSADGKKIAYLQTSQTAKSNQSNLIIKDLSDPKQKTTQIISLSQKDFDLEWISAQKIILVPKPSAFYQGTAWSVDIKNKTLNSLGPETYGLIVKWSADGKLGLKFSSQTQGQGGSLSLISDSGSTRATFPNLLTLPDKCFVSDPKIYCAIPQTISPQTILPDDYLKKAVYFNDSIYQIDILQNSLTEIFAATDPALDVSHLSLSANQLLFIDRYDNRLYGLEL
jgi:hypothetical protein